MRGRATRPRFGRRGFDAVAVVIGVGVALAVLLGSYGPPAGFPAPKPVPGPHPLASRLPTPYIRHVVVVVLENERLSEVLAHAPYERYLSAKYGFASNFYAACHPSAPNYLAMFAAVSNQCGSDTWHNWTNATLGVALTTAHDTWGAYAESLPSSACKSPGTATKGLFATRHVAALYFASDLKNRTYCRTHVESSNAFNTSVASGTLRNVSFYTPNLCDDGHDGCGPNVTSAQMTKQADTWLRDWLGPILNHTGRYNTKAEEHVIAHTAFIITWDEATGLLSNAGYSLPSVTSGNNYHWCRLNLAPGDAVCGGRIYTVVVSPYSLHRTMTSVDAPYGICRTIEWLFHLPPLGNSGGFDTKAGFPAMRPLFNFTANG